MRARKRQSIALTTHGSRTRRFVTLAAGCAALVLGIGTADGAVIRNTLTRVAPIDNHGANSWGEDISGIWVGAVSHHSVIIAPFVAGCNCAEAQLYAECYIWTTAWQPSTTVIANSQALLHFYNFECRHTSTYTLTLRGHVRGNAAIWVANPPWTWGGADAEYNIWLGWRIYDQATGALVGSASQYLRRVFSQHSGVAWWGANGMTPYEGDFTLVASDTELTAGRAYRSELEIMVDSNCTGVGDSRGTAHAMVVLSEMNGAFETESFACEDCGVQLHSVTFSDDFADTTPPVTHVNPANPAHCQPINVSLQSVDEVGGYGVESVYFRVGGGAWGRYTEPFPVSADGQVDFYGTDWAGNTETTQTIQYTIGAVPGPPALAGVPDGAADVPQPVALSWAPATGASSYHIQLDDDAAFGSPLRDESTVQNHYEAAGLPEGTTVHWRVQAMGACGNGPWCDPWSFTTRVITDVKPISTIDRLRLLQNSPNPFNPRTTIAFELPRDEAVRLAVWSAGGRHVATLIDMPMTAGRHEVDWDGRDAAGQPVASGIYLYTVDAGQERQTRRMSLVR